MIHGFLFGLGLVAAFTLVGSIMHRGLVRTIVDLSRLVFWGTVAVGVILFIAAGLFRLIAIEQRATKVSAQAPAANWLDEPEPAGCRK
jgi:hypothetical protein